MKRFTTAALLAVLVAAPAGRAPGKPPKGAPKVGEVGIVNEERSPERTIDGVGVARMPIDDDAWEEYVDASEAEDGPRLARMVAGGKLLLIANGTRARVIEYDDVAFRVLILDGPYQGRSGWIDEEAIVSLAMPVKRSAPRGPAKKKADDAARAPDPRPATSPTPDARAAGWLRTGQALEKAGKPDAALANYREIIARFPQSPAARTAAARIEALTTRGK